LVKAALSDSKEGEKKNMSTIKSILAWILDEPRDGRYRY